MRIPESQPVSGTLEADRAASVGDFVMAEFRYSDAEWGKIIRELKTLPDLDRYLEGLLLSPRSQGATEIFLVIPNKIRSENRRMAKVHAQEPQGDAKGQQSAHQINSVSATGSKRSFS